MDKITLDEVRHAAELVVLSQYAVAEMLVNRMGVTRLQADAIMKELADLGVISRSDGHGVHHVQVHPSAISTMLRNIADGEPASSRPVASGELVDDTVRLQAEKVIYHALPTSLSRSEAEATSRTVASRLIRTGWRPAAPRTG